MTTSVCRVVVLCLVFVGVVGSPHGSTATERNSEKSLQNRLRRLEREVYALRALSGQDRTAARQAVENAGASKHPTVGEACGADEFSCGCCQPHGGETSDESKYPTVRVGGFFQSDWGWFHQSPNNAATVGDIQDGADFRRARLNAHGDVAKNVGYMIEFDFAFPGRPSFMDVYLDIRETPLGTFRFGQWRQPFGMDGLTSVKELTFLERALPFAFLPFRQIGFGLFDHSDDESMTWAISTFRFPTDAFGGNVGDNGGYAMASRVTWLPMYNNDRSRILHIGAAYSFGDPANDRVRYRNQPEFFIGETGGADLVPAGVPTNVPPFVDTGPILTHNFHLFAVEGGLALGSFYMQSEAIYAIVDQIGGPTASFSGAYAHAGYFLTGEVRPYNRPGGVFGRVKPLRDCGPCGCGPCGCGAWEMTARWSYIDLNDADIAGGRLSDVTVGLNWYLNERTKFQFNYIHAALGRAPFGDSDANILACRGQIDF